MGIDGLIMQSSWWVIPITTFAIAKADITQKIDITVRILQHIVAIHNALREVITSSNDVMSTVVFFRKNISTNYT